MGVRFEHDIHDLASDLVKVASGFRREAPGVVARSAREGNEIAKGLARARNPLHARKYAGTFSWEREPGLAAEYGPEHKGQGMLAHILERSKGRSRNTAQFNLENSADQIGPVFSKRVGDMAEGLFWPGGDQ